jgi:hypothetical protein
MLHALIRILTICLTKWAFGKPFGKLKEFELSVGGYVAFRSLILDENLI